jgi:nicotinamidase/pyrazinamidase
MMNASGRHAADLPMAGDALLVVDMQRDFLPGGSLAMAGGESIIAPINACIERFVARGLPVCASRDWHPPNHMSFQAQGGPWPPHCVAGTPGADFPAALALPASSLVVSKACTPELEAYSAFDGTDLHRRLRALRVHRLFVAGLATDYCVLASVLDARALGYAVMLLRNAIAAVEPDGGARALARMAAAGAAVLDSASLSS